MIPKTKYNQPKTKLFKRVVGHYNSDQPGPTILCICCMHGNEPSGRVAFEKVIKRLNQDQFKIQGKLIGLIGNLAALETNRRFIDKDLNRLWTTKRMAGIKNGAISHSWNLAEITEQKDLFDHMQDIFESSQGPVIVLDLHTTSAPSQAFISINDTIRNRAFALNFQLPVILGIEEHLDGTVLNYINEIGYIALGIEAGQHDDPASVDQHETAIWLALNKSGCLDADYVPEHIRQRLNEKQSLSDKVFEVRYRHQINSIEAFEMIAGFVNFQPVKKAAILAKSSSGFVKAPEKGRIFMPLYQKQGDDGFFIVREIRRFWLSISKWLRIIDLHKLLPYIPGVSRYKNREYELVVNTKKARWLVVEFFHLLGFRRNQRRDSQIIFCRRKYDFKGPGTYQVNSKKLKK